MDRLIYTAMSGAKQIMLRQASNSHNLANANTSGFRADLDSFKDRPLFGPGYASRVYTEQQRIGFNAHAGALMQTGRELDIAVHGRGYIAVQAADGTEAYTRAGDLRVDSLGFLQIGAGHSVLGNGGGIVLPPFEKLEIAADGTISIQPLGQAASTLAAVDRIKLVLPEDAELIKREDGLLQHRQQIAVPADANVNLVSGALESSNVNVVDALVNMIELSRQFEINIKMMENADSNDRASASLMRIS